MPRRSLHLVRGGRVAYAEALELYAWGLLLLIAAAVLQCLALGTPWYTDGGRVPRDDPSRVAAWLVLITILAAGWALGSAWRTRERG